jgi:hypothetical protein
MDPGNKDSFILEDYDPKNTTSFERDSNYGDSVVDEVNARQAQLSKKSFLAICITLFCTMFVIAYYYYCTLSSHSHQLLLEETARTGQHLLLAQAPQATHRQHPRDQA